MHHWERSLQAPPKRPLEDLEDAASDSALKRLNRGLKAEPLDEPGTHQLSENALSWLVDGIDNTEEAIDPRSNSPNVKFEEDVFFNDLYLAADELPLEDDTANLNGSNDDTETEDSALEGLFRFGTVTGEELDNDGQEESDEDSCEPEEPESDPDAQMPLALWKPPEKYIEYQDLLKSSIVSFFNLEYDDCWLKPNTKPTDLEDGTVTRNGAYYGDGPGVSWTGDEKEIFFRCLARYSIHNAHDFLPHLPKKSLTDIYMYYDMLKLQLEKMRKDRKVLVAIRVFQRHWEYNEFEHEMRFNEDGISQTDIPTALEMPEEFVILEERFSIEANRRDHQLYLRHKSQTFSPMIAHVSKGLVHHRNLKRFNTALRDSPWSLKPLLPGRRHISFDCYVLLEELVKLVTREIFSQIQMGRLASLGRRRERHPKKTIPLRLVSAQAVWDAVDRLHLFETKVGIQSFHRDGKMPDVEMYFQKLGPSIGFSQEIARQVRINSFPNERYLRRKQAFQTDEFTLGQFPLDQEPVELDSSSEADMDIWLQEYETDVLELKDTELTNLMKKRELIEFGQYEPGHYNSFINNKELEREWELLHKTPLLSSWLKTFPYYEK